MIVFIKCLDQLHKDLQYSSLTPNDQRYYVHYKLHVSSQPRFLNLNKRSQSKQVTCIS